ncbi:hypothetical protein [Rhodococcus sp. Leaf233]|uniref:hypothetical protein n=1 Tax=Rhodococcus sp. Leaf233 TaxID=1736302 RepID=UPI000B2060E7|nr:hypothetical protein [Rhodococcus sp. Leaf233]
MRIRSTKPEFWRSERIAQVDWDARLVLKGLESYVDDNGVGKDDIALIVGDLFQRDLVREPSRTLARVSEALTDLNSAGLVHRYEADGTKLLFVSFWDSIQRVDKPQNGRFPRPDGTLNYKDSVIREPDGIVREPSRTLAPVTGEQGNRGTGEQGATKPSRKRPATPIPDDWKPNDAHKAKATDRGVDVDHEAEQMRTWAIGKDERKANWDAAFHNWLGNARPPLRSVTSGRDGTTGRLWQE